MNQSQAPGEVNWLESSVPRHWCRGDAFETRFLEAMSLIAPEVERFVMGAVLRNFPRGAGSQSRAMTFIREEAGHSRVHHAFNRRLSAQGIEIAKVLAWVRRAADLARHWLPRSGQLAVAAASEHVSAVLSLCFLRAAPQSVIRPASVFHLFELHARDELGHRTIVFELSRGAGGARWAARAAALALVSCFAVLCVPKVVNALLEFDRPAGRARLWAGTALRLLRGESWVSPLAFLRGWLSYLRPGFHPEQLPEH